MGKKIIFTVTNDLRHDQRMQRICGTLAKEGYDIWLIGRKLSGSKPLAPAAYHQKRIRCFFKKGAAFYAEYNIRLFFFLLFTKADAICAIDLDTILPCLYISKWKKIPRIYDAHELFTGLKEVATRPRVLKVWQRIERRAVPQFQSGYTVSESIALEFNRRYGVSYSTIRNMPLLRELPEQHPEKPFILYQGAVNEARGFEMLIPAMKKVDTPLVICGDGNFMPQLKKLIRENGVEEKVVLKGMLPPEELLAFSPRATIAVAVPENTGLNQYLALPNKFFDYLHAGLPQVTVNYPEYAQLNRQFEVAVLLENPDPETIAAALNNLLYDSVLYKKLKENCLRARLLLNWQEEENKLIEFYKSVLPS
jgi:glycosyltransferase involved in cell wall biosynthesis